MENHVAQSPASTLGELKASGYQTLGVREEMRRNLMNKLAGDDEIFPGVVGYEDTVIPQIENAVLSGQDIILLGERGQAKSRMIRSLISLLDETIPVIDGCEVPENPLAPITAQGRNIVAEHGDDTPIRWMSREDRYGEKLATPDITIADLIGEVDPIKIAEGRYLSDEEALHYGMIPHTNRGIFAINELPDLAERIQVGLLNVMEERDVQIRGHKVRMDLDVLIVATANPEDYTNRGRIITPLKDRYGAQIRTHYPQTALEEITIMEQEQTQLDMGEYRQNVPAFMQQIVAEITQLARRSPDISQRSGVSVRASVSNYEALVANALRRSIRTGEQDVVPRISDLPFIMPSLQGKVEFEAMEDGQEDKIMSKLFEDATRAVFERFMGDEAEVLALQFSDGLNVTTGESIPSNEYEDIVRKVDGLSDIANKLGGDNSAIRASVVEFVLEGLHLNQLLNKDRVSGHNTYSA
ncbi:MAG: magnesium chelatase [Gammaproteobacteria bacterium]|nr:magnesium chelatase [Gammaproteobacteria bacterium]OUU07857.1 MAG: magnesium chelatase [Gammaproteobacteria bacterium TMED34]